MTVSRRFVLGGLATLTMPAIVHAKMWPIVDAPSYFNKELNQGAKKWFEDATNKKDNSCCSTADGFRRGFTYLIGELIGNDVKQVERLMFTTIKPTGVGYTVSVYDVVTHGYVDLPVTDEKMVKQSGNPTGCDIVWLGHGGSYSQQIFVRCLSLANEV